MKITLFYKSRYSFLTQSYKYLVQSLSVPFSVDNISIDKKTGHLWVAVLSKSIELGHHFSNIR